MPNFKTNKMALYVSAFFVVILVLFAIFRDNSDSITLSQAKKMLNDKSVKNVVVTKEYAYLKTQHAVFKLPMSQVNPVMFKNYKVEVGSESNIIFYIFIIVLIIGIGSLIVRLILKNINPKIASQKHSIMPSDVSVVQSIKSDVKFDDIGGISDVKIELEEIIDFIKKPTKYKSFGARMPRGVLLIGPPGVGKTMIAKAVASEANVPFFYQSGASFVQIYVGMGAKRVHELFNAAKKNAPSIIFIDEIDAVGKKRDGQRNDEREATLNQLLTEMDGFEASSGVIVIAATNKIDVLDEALLRSGRFDRRVFVELPTKIERASILSKYLDKVPHDLDISKVANMTVSFNGASLAALVNEAALLCIRHNDIQITIEHIYMVKDKVMFGKKKLQILSDKQKQYRVTYQAAKAITATFYNIPFEKLLLSNEKLTPETNEPFIKHELENRVKMLLSGMVACGIKYGEHSSDAKIDLDQAKELVFKMVNEYGMSSSLINNSDEQEIMMRKLYTDTGAFLESVNAIIDNVEKDLYENESITKKSVKAYLDEIF
ncbi:MAG: AAA family ATPase [Sulfurimonas sp.]|nr:AAA family ATPase [Sulfurimonas sp.]